MPTYSKYKITMGILMYGYYAFPSDESLLMRLQKHINAVLYTIVFFGYNG